MGKTDLKNCTRVNDKNARLWLNWKFGGGFKLKVKGRGMMQFDDSLQMCLHSSSSNATPLRVCKLEKNLHLIFEVIQYFHKLL
jgi:hypothetical protein